MDAVLFSYARRSVMTYDQQKKERDTLLKTVLFVLGHNQIIRGWDVLEVINAAQQHRQLDYRAQQMGYDLQTPGWKKWFPRLYPPPTPPEGLTVTDIMGRLIGSDESAYEAASVDHLEKLERWMVDMYAVSLLQLPFDPLQDGLPEQRQYRWFVSESVPNMLENQARLTGRVSGAQSDGVLFTIRPEHQEEAKADTSPLQLVKPPDEPDSTRDRFRFPGA
ncbi:MAG: hypothetical protein K2X01_00935 [Cyanobacteria bacterium]|nr:hypothetical protein [Cyanobacteriota bacterium]